MFSAFFGRRIFPAVIVLLAVCPAQSLAKGDAPIVVSTLVKCNQQKLWDTVAYFRLHDPEISSTEVLNDRDDVTIWKQRTKEQPLIGSAVITLRFTSRAPDRIDYQLVESDKLKEMAGSWILSPTKDPKVTQLTITTNTQSKLPIPHWLLNPIVKAKLESQERRIKRMAEASP